MRLVTLDNDIKAWEFSSSQYVRSAVENVRDYIEKRGWKFPRVNIPISTIYRPELDISLELDATDSAYY